MFLLSIGEGQATYIITYNATTKVMDMKLQHESELKDKVQFFLFWDITDHHLIKGTNLSYEVLVNWEDNNTTWDPM